MNQKQKMYQRIERHGLQLLAIFPDARETDPVKLCKKLRRIEAEGNRHGEAMCNSAEYCATDTELAAHRIIEKVKRLLNSNRPWLNQDPRGYALKMDLEPTESLHKDWGGYGILAPDLTEE